MNIRTCVSLILLFIYACMLSVSSTIYFIMLAPLVLEIWRNKKYLKNIFNKLLFLNIFLIILAISLWLLGDKKLAVLIYLRSNMTILFALLLFSNKNAFDIALGLQQLRMPHKINTLFFFVAKFIYIIKKNIEEFKKTLHVRGFLPKASLFTYKTYANFIGMMFINAIKKSHNLQNLMILRGFNGKLYTLQESQSLSTYEVILSIVVGISVLFKQGIIV